MSTSLRAPFDSVGRRAVPPVLLALLALLAFLLGLSLAAGPPEGTDPASPGRPGTAGTAAPGHPGATGLGEAGGGCRCPWSAERARVVDLMLDGAFAEALDLSEELLADPALPAPVARRIAELRTRAVRELEGRDPVAVAPEPEPEPDRPPPLDVTFHVRSTRPGRSFRAGDDGRLRVSAHGITFVPDDGAEDGRWSVPWSAFESAGEAEGIWDVAHPLVVRTEEGDRFFLVHVGPEERFEDGEQILRYIEKGRKRFTVSMDEVES